MATSKQNTTVTQPVKQKATQMATLGTAQIELETTTREHLAAQANYVKAVERLSVAEEAHTNAMTALVNEVTTLRDKCKVPNITLKN